MSISEVCIKRPVFASMMSLALILFGFVALNRLPVRELPDIDPPVVSVVTVYPGASARLVETEVTEPLEKEINNISGIKTLRSESREQVSAITVEFELNVDVDIGSQDVRDRVSRVRNQLPDDIEEPIISKLDTNAQEIMWIALYSDKYSTLELTEMAELRIKDRLSTISGVGGVNFGGEKRPAIRLWLDAEKMASRNVTASDVRAALQRENVELPAGKLEGLKREFSIQAKGRMNLPGQYENLIIRYESDGPVRLGDIGRATLGVENETTIARFNSRPAVGLGIVKQSEANAVEVAKRVKEEVELIRKDLPPGIEVRIPYDSSIYVDHAIEEVKFTLFVAFGLVVLVIFLFLRNLRSTLIPALAIPVSIIGTFAILQVMGYSINILTLLALVLAIGVVVDDAIVVLENIYRHIEQGMDARSASLLGMKEITTAVISTTLSLVAVFIPIAVQTGTTGILFREFAVAMAGSVIISSFVALTLTPALCAQILSAPKAHGRVYLFFESIFDWITDVYMAILKGSLRHKLAVASIAVLSLGASFYLYRLLPLEFLPEEDKGFIISIFFAPEGSTSEYTDEHVKQAEDIIREVPEVQGYFSAVAFSRDEGPGQPDFGVMFSRLKEKRSRTAQAINRPGAMGTVFTRMMNEIKGIMAISFLPRTGERGEEQYKLVLQCQDLELLDETAQKVQAALARENFLSAPRLDFNFNKPEVEIEIDREKAASAGVSVREISETLQMLFGGQEISNFIRSGKQYDVIAQLDRPHRMTPDDLYRIYVRSGSGDLVQLRDLIRTRQQGTVNVINRFQRYRSASIGGEPQGVTLGEAIDQTEKIISPLLPKDVFYRWDGTAREIIEGKGEAISILILAILIIYMVLAAQFESLVHPFTVMLALPMAVFGAFLLLYVLNIVNGIAIIKAYAPLEELPGFLQFLTLNLPEIPSMTLNMYSLIGFVLLIGLVTKNSILLVEFANQRMEDGLSATDAMLEAGRIRLRPIMMTALATIIGILPIALAIGAGAESRRSMGVAVMGGMITSTVLTLFVVPVVYILLDRLRNLFRHKPLEP